MTTRNLGRRNFIRLLVGGAGALGAATLLEACGPATAPAAPTTPPAPAAAPTTAAAAAPTTSAAPAQAAPTVAPAAAPTAAGAAAPQFDDTAAGPVPFRKDTVANALTPKRGGSMTTTWAGGFNWNQWDPMKTQTIQVNHMFFTSNKLIQGDWTKGPQGSGQTSWDWGYLSDVNLLTGELAESWETPDPTTIVYHIRKGVKFHNKPPVNGREVTADDVVWNIQMQFDTPTAWQAIAYPKESGLQPTSIKATDRYTVEVKTPEQSRDLMLLEIGCNMYHNPPEVWQNGGDMSDWTKVIGSGPWMISDYVDGSQVTFTRNPDYFENDPLHPDQQVPYLDTLKILLIPDVSSQLTALRTGQIDWVSGQAPDDARPVVNDNPNLLWSRRVGLAWDAVGRQDKPDLPFKDLKVRQALNLAVDKQSYLKDYLKGQGVLLGYPYPPTPSYAKYFTPLDQLPQDAQMLFTGYSPDQAKKLLADAGYPNGFQTVIQGPASRADEMALIQSYLAKVGVDMQIQTLDPGQFNSVNGNNNFDQMLYTNAIGIWAPDEMLTTKKGMLSNHAHMDDPYYVQVQQSVAQNMVANPDQYFKTMKDAGVHELQSAWAIFMPVPYQYNMWWPYTQNYYGINWTGWAGVWQWTKYLWIDQDLKKSMGH
jgi:peptide/nickel transport system substrate-binding protein